MGGGGDFTVSKSVSWIFYPILSLGHLIPFCDDTTHISCLVDLQYRLFFNHPCCFGHLLTDSESDVPSYYTVNYYYYYQCLKCGQAAMEIIPIHSLFMVNDGRVQHPTNGDCHHHATIEENIRVASVERMIYKCLHILNILVCSHLSRKKPDSF